MPHLKKQKSNTGNAIVTLHHFFQSNSSRSRQNYLPTKHKPRTYDDVVVIDSDEDEVEIIEGPVESGKFDYDNGNPSTNDCLPRTSPAAYLSFGTPVLLQPRPPSAELPRAVHVHDGAEATKKPLFLPDEDDEPIYVDSPKLAPSDFTMQSDETFDWRTGDDERNLVSAPEQDDEYFEDEGKTVVQSSTSYSESYELEIANLKPTSNGGNNVFSVLMSSLKEDEAWKEASILEDRSIRPTKNNRRKAPFYKVLQGMPIAVDAFRYGTIPNVTAYFLTHAHSDHYTNLSSSWKSGPIYCSEGTANLIIHMLAVDKKWVHPLPMDIPTIIPNTGGVCVTLIEANHCPGSCLFFFEGPQTINAGDSIYKSLFVGSSRIFRYLHCGDFRASPRHVLHPAVKGKKIDHVYLDTTYLDPKYTFPPQPLVISACAELAKRISQGELVSCKSSVEGWFTKTQTTSSGTSNSRQNGRILFVVGTYSIGKERILKAVAQALQSKVYCDARKAALLRCEADDDLNAMICSDPLSADVHILPLSMITSDKLKAYLEKYEGHFKKAVGFRPTGWTYAPSAGADQMPPIASVLSKAPHRNYNYSDLQSSRQSTNTLQIYHIPYSEHSSFFELTCFAMSFTWTRMIATVNVGSELSRGKQAKWISKWEAERKKRDDGVVPYRNSDYW